MPFDSLEGEVAWDEADEEGEGKRAGGEEDKGPFSMMGEVVGVEGAFTVMIQAGSSMSLGRRDSSLRKTSPLAKRDDPQRCGALRREGKREERTSRRDRSRSRSRSCSSCTP